MKVLIIDDSVERRAQMIFLLQQAVPQSQPIEISTVHGLTEVLAQEDATIALIAAGFAGMGIGALLTTLSEQRPGLPAIVLSDVLDEAQGIEALQHGARDVVLQQQLYRLPLALRTVLNAPFQPAHHLLEPQPEHQPPSAQPYDAHFQALFEDAPIGISIARAGITCAVNRAYLRMFGYTNVAQVVGQPLLRDVAPHERGRIAERIRQREQGAPVPTAYEMMGQRQDASLFPSHVEIGRITFHGAPASVGFFTDITARKQAEERLHFLTEVSAVLATSLDYTTTLERVARLTIPYLADWCGVDMLVENGSLQRLAVAHTDPAKEAMVREGQRRYPPDPARPHPTLRVLTSGQSERMPDIPDALLQAIAQDAEHLELMRTLGFRSALYVPLTVRGRVLGAITLIMAESERHYTEADQTFAEDVARRCALALDNARLYAEAQQAIKARDQFVTIASHELKTPLTAMLGYVELLQRRNERAGLLGERDTRMLQTVARQGVRLTGLVNELLDFSRLNTDQLQIEPAPLNIAVLVQRLVEDIQPTLDQHRLVAEYPDTELVVWGDEVRLEQVLYNIVNNAIKYSPAGGTVAIGVEQQEGDAYVVVRDEGIGIPAAALTRLGEAFFRAENATLLHIGGTGVGLYIAKAILVLHGGRLDVESVEGQGTTVTLLLPCKRPSEPS
jgi:PAS domain S-box-containing protein